MRILTCLTQDHNLLLVFLAALMCVLGSYVSVKLFRRTLLDNAQSRFYWCVLAAVVAGAATWATHFIAMLGYQPSAPVSFDGTLTIISALIAIAGMAIGLIVAMLSSRAIAALCGGGIIGLAIAAMHYVGMFAYRVDGIVAWLPAYVFGSIAVSIAGSAMAIDQIKHGRGVMVVAKAVAWLTAAIVGLHFTGMAAFVVTPILGVSVGSDSEAFSAMAMAIALVAFLILGAGISTHLLEKRTRSLSDDKLRHAKLHDDLTKVANHRKFAQALAQVSDECAQDARAFALLLINLDYFKAVNQTHGHRVGDTVLFRAAKRLQVALPEEDLLVRLSGDEFAVIAYDVHAVAEAQALANRMIELVGRPFVARGRVVEIGASVGVVHAKATMCDPETLRQHADVALQAAKQEGRGRSCVYRPEMQEALERRRQLEAELRRACTRDEFQVAYQPILDARSGRITGAESLVRWRSPSRGAVSPAEFVPIAEELGLVARIGSSVLKQACLEASSWPDHISVSVNVSPVQLLDPRFARTVRQALEDSGLASERLELEITETALFGNDELAMRTLRQIKGLGVKVSLDDFGTGYSSMSHLHRFPIDKIKIDSSFVRQVPEDEASAAITRAIAQFAKSLRLKITAEGIETEAQRAFLANQGCDNLQGFLFGKPLSPEDFRAFVAGRESWRVAV